MKAVFITLKKIRYPFFKLMECFCCTLPVKSNIILFEGKPDYSDNPRALCEYLMSHGYTQDKKIFFIVRDKKKIQRLCLYKDVTFLSARNFLGMIPLRTMAVVYSASITFASHSFTQPMCKYKKGQRHILLWHGCGYKGPSSNNSCRFFDLALVPGKLFIESKCRFWNTSPEFLLGLGYPRYDWLITPNKNAQIFGNQLKIKYCSEKIIIWMPTFRNSKVSINYKENSLKQFPMMENRALWIELDKFCKEHKVLLIVKLHMSQKSDDMEFTTMDNIICISNDDVEKKKCVFYEFLVYTDALITDYSSVAIDYLLTNRPIAFLLNDFDKYKNTRGFVFDDPREFMPGHHIYEFKDLLKFIYDVSKGNDIYADEREKMSSVAIFKSTCYCKTIMDGLMI